MYDYKILIGVAAFLVLVIGPLLLGAQGLNVARRKPVDAAVDPAPPWGFLQSLPQVVIGSSEAGRYLSLRDLERVRLSVGGQCVVLIE